MPNQYSALTRENILRKMNRKKNPVKSVTQLAREYGVNTAYRRKRDYWGRDGCIDHRAPANFVARVKSMLSTQEYEQLRQGKAVNLLYR